MISEVKENCKHYLTKNRKNFSLNFKEVGENYFGDILQENKRVEKNFNGLPVAKSQHISYNIVIYTQEPSRYQTESTGGADHGKSEKNTC